MIKLKTLLDIFLKGFLFFKSESIRIFQNKKQINLKLQI